MLFSVVAVFLVAGLVPSVHGSQPLLSRCFNDGEVALTFEGGPDPNLTPLVLDALKKSNTTATFFLRAVALNGWAAISVAKRIVADGHIIGLLVEPTMEEKSDISIDTLSASISNHLDILEKTVGKRPKFLRATYSNTTAKFGDFLNSSGYICTGAAIDCNDPAAPHQSPLKAIINLLAVNPNAIIRARDTNSLNANMAKDIIEYLKITSRKKLVSIVECTGMAYAYDKDSDKAEGSGVGDKALDFDGNLFQAPKKPVDTAGQQDSGKLFGVQIANGAAGAAILRASGHGIIAAALTLLALHLY